MENLEPAQGYDQYAPFYKKDHALLDSFDWGVAHTWWKEAYALQAAMLADLKAANPTARPAGLNLVDAGCGDGRTMARHEKWLEGREMAQLKGFDISPVMIKLAAQKVKLAKFSLLDLEDETARRAWVKANGRADLLSAFFLLVHIREVSEFFEAVNDLLVPGGMLIMNSIPQRKPPVLLAKTKRFTIRSYTHYPDRVREAGWDAGLDLVREQNCEEEDQVISTVFWWQKPAQARS